MSWIPVENDPTVLNEYIKAMGVTDDFEIVDVYGVSEDFLSMIPKPVEAFFFVFPINAEIDKLSCYQAKKCAEEAEQFTKDNNLSFLVQKIPNACGAVALGHAFLNNHNITVTPGSPADYFRHREKGEGRDSRTKGDSLPEESLSNIVMSELEGYHERCAKSGVSKVDYYTNLHFVCYLSVGGRCVEFDGRRKNIILHGNATNQEEFIREAARAMQEKVLLSPDSIEFSITALVKTQG